MAMKGERAGRFMLERRLGRGLEGEVWRARDSGGGVPSAVKLFTEPGAADAFRRSGAPTVPQQENLCGVLEANPEGMPPFLAIEFVEGPTLREVLQAEGHVPLSAAIPTLIQVMRGLQALHREKLAHRDLR